MPDAVPAVRHRKQNELVGRGQLAQEAQRLKVRRLRAGAIAIAQWGADQRGQRDEDVLIPQQVADEPFIAAITADDLKAVVRATVEQTILPVEKCIEHGDAKASLKKLLAQHRSDIPCSAGYQDMTPIVTRHRMHLSVSSRHHESRRAGCFPAPSHHRFKPFHSFLQTRFQRGKAKFFELSVERAAGQPLHTDAFRFRTVILNRAVELHRVGDQLSQHVGS